MRCPICGEEIHGEPAISRIDNRTEICRDCGIMEAFEAYIDYIESNGKENTHE